MCMFPLCAIGCTLLVFSVCIAIDKLRIALVFNPLKERISKMTEKVERHLEEVMR